jgi:hypothetical protein
MLMNKVRLLKDTQLYVKMKSIILKLYARIEA